MRRQFATLSLLSACLSCAISTNTFAASVQTISNPVPNGFIKLDGNISEWLSISRFNEDTTGDGSTGSFVPIDIRQGAVAHDDNFFYFLYRNSGDNMVTGASNWIFIDLDQNATTGLTAAGGINFSIGAEFNLGGTGGWNQWNAAGGHAGSAAGKLAVAGDSNASGGADFIEFSVSRTAIQPGGGTFNPPGTSFNVLFVAENTTTPDYSPNNGAVDWFTYNASGVYNPGVAGDADGNGIVNINDYLLIQANSFTIVPLGTQGDVNDSGFVDFDDFQQWKTSFPGGVEAAEAAIAAVPEPTSLALALGAAGMLSMKRRKRGA
ncbi:PEP-CTERM sorting domain-containing protein [Lacipirellula parvula]|uniref:PEP-CTERM protein-sorting domain-containing protein n=1 Tax=Lacipirellula parvula TaxID=2650471 RepID=A0A5K7XH40_9BACT|nr:PEP-CTERM sorting domain-containing protein [Lacipirellula parvula]BBO33606.1 hypothetical protein PLANPX_3218 [Lacipirellula parvula]